MSANKETTSSSSSGDAHAEKSVDKLNVREFRERFFIPNGVSVELMDGEAVPTEKAEDNAICFTKEQFNAGLRFPLPSLFNSSLHPDSSGLYSSQHGPSADGVQHSGHAIQSGSLTAGGSLHLFDQEGEK